MKPMTDMTKPIIGLALMMMGLLISLTGIGLCCGLPVILIGLAMAIAGATTNDGQNTNPPT
jgi:hypothetical protein